VRPGDSLEVSIAVANDAWLLAWAKDIRVRVFMPEGFTISRTGTNDCELNFSTLHGNYTITIKVYAENVPEQIHSLEMIVLVS